MLKFMLKINTPLHVQFERFRRIFHHSTYRVLLGHKERKIMSTLFVEEVECLFLFNFFFLYYLKKLMLYGVMSFKSNRTNTSSGFGFVEVDRRKRRYFNLQWFRFGHDFFRYIVSSYSCS